MSPLAPRALLKASAVLAVPLAAAAAASAATVTATLTVGGGHMYASPVAERVALQSWQPYRGSWRRAVVRIPLRVADLRGTGAGWTLAMRGLVVTPAGRPVTAAKASIWRVRVRCVEICTRPRAVPRSPAALSSSLSTRALTAPRNSGMGRMRVLVDVAVTVPASTRVPLVLLPRVARVTGP